MINYDHASMADQNVLIKPPLSCDEGKEQVQFIGLLRDDSKAFTINCTRFQTLQMYFACVRYNCNHLRLQSRLQNDMEIKVTLSNQDQVNEL